MRKILLFLLLILNLIVVSCTHKYADTIDLKETTIKNYVYRLDSGDKLRVLVYQEPDFSGTYEVSDIGTISMPYVKTIKVKNLTTVQLEKVIEKKFHNEQVLLNPKVSIEIIEYRPFYIHGEVMKAGEYAYKPHLNLSDAIALAGGYSYRADTDIVYIRREGAAKLIKATLKDSQNIAVYPGDNIEIAERSF
jgi:polysaccharide export outer membrane protein